MHILIAGGAGFAGSNLTRYFLDKGYKVTVVDNLSTGVENNLAELSRNPQFRFEQADVASPEFLQKFSDVAAWQFDRVYDLACPTGVPNIAPERLGLEMLEACSNGTKNLLEVARVHNAKFLITSSSEVYGEPLVTPQAESYTGNVDMIGFRAPYEEGKRFAETLVDTYARKYNMHAKIVRLFNMYGPYMALVDFRVIPRFVTQALRGEPLTVQGDGSQRRTLCYVSDLLAGLETAMEHGVPGEAYNLGSREEITMLDFAKKIIALTNSTSQIIHVDRPSHDHSSRMPDLTRIHALGWKQSVSLDDGLRLTIENFRNRLPAQAEAVHPASELVLNSVV